MARYRRVIRAFVLIAGVNLALAGGYWAINQGRTNPDGSEIGYLQCLYMTVVSTFTVGYGELVPVTTAADRLYTMFVIVLGLGTIVSLCRGRRDRRSGAGASRHHSRRRRPVRPAQRPGQPGVGHALSIGQPQDPDRGQGAGY